MSIISQESFNKLTEEEKNWIIKEYNSDAGEGHSMLGKLFGEENLQPEPKIKTWEDVVKYTLVNPLTVLESAGYAEDICDEKIGNKVEATLKIAKLIELGYGGMITEEEWKLSSSYTSETTIWTIVCEYKAESKEPQFRIARNWDQPELVSFHTKEQAEEFMSYPENRKLVEQYYMI